MIDQLFGILKVIGKENRLKSIFLLAILLMIVLLELLNFSLVIPILSIIFGNEVNDYKLLNMIKDNFGVDTKNIILIGALFIIILLIKILVLLFFEYKIQKFSREINIDISLKAYSYFLHASWQEIFEKDHAYMMRNILGDTGTFVQQGVMKIIELLKNSILLFFIMGYLFFINFEATIGILLLLIIFVSIFMIFFRRKFLKLSEMTVKLETFRFKNISESIINLRDIKLTGSAGYFLKLFKGNENEISKIVITDAVINKIPRYLLELIIVFFIFLLLLYFKTKNFEMVELIPILGLYAFAAARMIPIFTVYNQSLQAIKTAKYQIDEVIKNASRFSKLIIENNTENEIINFEKQYENDLEIKITNLTFSYNKNSQIFKDLNLKLNKNCTIFIEGPNGSGKSTFVDLLSGMLKPKEGTIEINGKNMELISENWKKNIGYVSQSNFLINASIKDNIIFGRKNISKKDLEKVIKIVGIESLINNLPNGLETNVGNLGSQLSGGQKQRISIARALLTDPKVIILDEATNALDIEGEKKFLEIINKIKKDKIIFFIAHSNVIKNFCDISYKIKDKNILFEGK